MIFGSELTQVFLCEEFVSIVNLLASILICEGVESSSRSNNRKKQAHENKSIHTAETIQTRRPVEGHETKEESKRRTYQIQEQRLCSVDHYRVLTPQSNAAPSWRYNDYQRMGRSDPVANCK